MIQTHKYLTDKDTEKCFLIDERSTNNVPVAQPV